jgi:hypothetical protein
MYKGAFVPNTWYVLPMPTAQFSSDIRKEVAIALHANMADPEVGEQRVVEACARVCTETHAMHLTAEQMVLALTRLYAELPGEAKLPSEEHRRHEAFDTLLAGCRTAYLDAERAARTHR